MPKTKITKGDIESVAEKLEEFASTLPKQEQDVLGWVLTRAQAAPENDMAAAAAKAVKPVAGFRNPIASQLARSVGLGRAAGPQVTVVVGWSYRFKVVNPRERLERVRGRVRGGR